MVVGGSSLNDEPLASLASFKSKLLVSEGVFSLFFTNGALIFFDYVGFFLLFFLNELLVTVCLGLFCLFYFFCFQPFISNCLNILNVLIFS